VCFVVLKTTSELERVILTTLYLASAKNTNSCCARKGDLQRAFPLDVLMVPSSVLTAITDGEPLACGGFSLGKTIRFRSLDFITDCFSGLSLSPRRDGSDAIFMGSTYSRLPSLLWAMIGDYTDEFHKALSREGGSGLPSPRRHDTGAPPAPIATTSWMENTLAGQAMMVVPLRTVAPWSDTSLPFE
jgi:hypothetical protein